jgi:hypothetical protein
MYRHSKLLAGSATLLLAGCGHGTALLGASTAATPPARVAAAPASPTPPPVITARLINRQRGTAKVGTIVPSSGLGQRIIINKRVRVALGSVGQAQYPAETTDGGALWKTFGPALHTNAAQAPLAVTQIGVANPRTIYFYGSGQVVDATGDGGKHWWRAFTQGLSAAVVPGIGRRLVWFTQTAVGGNDAHALTWTYVSNDGDTVWHYTTALGGGF